MFPSVKNPEVAEEGIVRNNIYLIYTTYILIL